MAVEHDTNPFLRVGEASVRRAAASRLGRDPDSDVECFAAIREWKNVFR
ncbi:MAG: hydroxyacylglutathione hydrolase C-terminal domain-containing protein [bacterium]